MRFNGDDDDNFMRSVIANYAAESRDGDGVPTAQFFLDAAAARRLGAEVLATHMKLADGEVKPYLDTYF